MTSEDKEKLKEVIRVQLDHAVDGVFFFAHSFAKTKSGDITPEQQFKLKQLQDEIAKLIFEQTIQNTEDNG